MITTKKACIQDELLETVADTKVYEPFNENIKQVEISLSDFNRWMIQILISGVEKSSDD